MTRTAAFRAIAGCFLGFALAVPGAAAQDYPTRAVRLIVTFAPGGGSDLLGRATAELLGQRLG